MGAEAEEKPASEGETATAEEEDQVQQGAGGGFGDKGQTENVKPLEEVIVKSRRIPREGELQHRDG